MKTIKLISLMLFALQLLSQSVSLYATPHVHGEADLTIVMEGDNVQIQFMAPASDVVGFEHKATSPEQQQVLTNARAVLSEFANVVVLSGGECEISKVNIDMSGLEAIKHELYEQNNKHGREHQYAHPNITATYDFKCKRLEKLSSVNISVFDAFPAISRINSIWIGEHLQGSLGLSSPDRRISFQ